MEASPITEESLVREVSPSWSHVVGVGLCDSAALLWRMEDLRSVRSRGLVGALLGALPRTPRQNGRLGRPLLLLPEEERLLTERHATAALPPASQVSLTHWSVYHLTAPPGPGSGPQFWCVLSAVCRGG